MAEMNKQPNAEMAPAKKKRHSLSAFTILVIILAVLCIISVLLNGAEISDSIIKTLDPEKYGDLLEMVDGGEHVSVVAAKLQDFVMASPKHP